MDTAQRGMGLDWTNSLELIRRTLEDVPEAVVASGAGTDHLTGVASVSEVIAAYEMQCSAIEKLNGRIILMASRALAAGARSPDDYAKVYDRILGQVRQPVIIHWLGEMFDPALAGYWGKKDHYEAMDVCLSVLEEKQEQGGRHQDIAARQGQGNRHAAQAPEGHAHVHRRRFQLCRAYRGRRQGYSDALLGIFDSIAPAASQALTYLKENNKEGYHEALAPTVPLSRHIFQAPTRFYKTGVVFMAWLNGHQRHFTMVGGQQSARNIQHLAELFRLADAAGLLQDPGLACRRMQQLLSVHGIQ